MAGLLHGQVAVSLTFRRYTPSRIALTRRLKISWWRASGLAGGRHHQCWGPPENSRQLKGFIDSNSGDRLMSVYTVNMPYGEYPGQYLPNHCATDYNPALGEILDYGMYM